MILFVWDEGTQGTGSGGHQSVTMEPNKRRESISKNGLFLGFRKAIFTDFAIENFD